MAPTLSHQGCSTADQGPGLGPSYLQSGLGGTGIAHHGNSRANVNNVLARNNYWRYPWMTFKAYLYQSGGFLKAWATPGCDTQLPGNPKSI